MSSLQPLVLQRKDMLKAKRCTALWEQQQTYVSRASADGQSIASQINYLTSLPH
jgi:hypothetical protein